MLCLAGSHSGGGSAGASGARCVPAQAWRPLDVWPSPLHEFRGQIDHHPTEPPGRDYYAHHNPAYFGPGSDVPEFYCKEKPILMKLAYLVGLITFLGHFYVTVPLGCVSDRYGRKVVLVLNDIAVLLAFSWVMLVATPTKLCQSKQSLPHPFFTCSEGTSMLRQQTHMPSLPM